MPSLSSSLTPRRRWIGAAVFFAGLLLLFGADLVAWLRFGLGSSLYSYTLLVPLISVFLLTDRDWRALREPPSAELLPVLVIGGFGLALLSVLGFGRWDLDGPVNSWRLVLLATTAAGGVLCWRGSTAWTGRLFPALFLYFAIPLTPEWEHALSEFLQRWSGWLAYHLIQWTGTPIVREGPLLILPGLNLEVAEECSGIRSTIVLLVTSILAAYLFLRRFPVRLAFVAMVIPLGILRNAFRILVISWLTLYVDPGVIHGPLHRRGGPLFFALSLVLLFAWLCLLRAWDRKWLARKK